MPALAACDSCVSMVHVPRAMRGGFSTDTMDDLQIGNVKSTFSSLRISRATK